MQKRTKISEVLEQNTQPSQTTEKESANNNLHILKTALAGLTAGTVETLPMAAGFLANSPKILYNAVKYPFNKQAESSLEIFSPLADSKLTQLGLKGGDWVRQKFGIDDLSKLTPSEQAAYMTGDFAPIFATGGTYGLIKAGSTASKVAGKTAVKALAKKGASLSAKKALYKKGAIVGDTLTSFAVPGIQVSKKASLPVKTFQLGVQAIPGITNNELMHLNAENAGLFGDYGNDFEDITLLKDKRKIGKKEFMDQLNPDLYEQYKIDKELNKQKRSKFLQNLLSAAAIMGVSATALGAGSLAARYTTSGQKLANKILTNINNKTGYDRLSATQKLDFATANKYAFMDDLRDLGLLPEEVVNSFYRDNSVIVNRAWTEGKIVNDNLNIDLGVKPLELYNDIKNLVIANPKIANRLHKFLEDSRYIQDEAYKYNKSLEDVDPESMGLSTNEFLYNVNKKSLDQLAKDNQYEVYNAFRRNTAFTTKYFKDPRVKKILTQLSTLNNSLLDYYSKSHYYNNDQIYKMKRNRTMIINQFTDKGIDAIRGFDDKPIALNLYKEAIRSEPNKTVWQRFKYFVDKASYSDESLGYLKSAAPRSSIDNLNIGEAEDLINVLEKSIKSTIYNVEKNTRLTKLAESYSENNIKQLQDYLVEAIMKENTLRKNYEKEFRNGELLDPRRISIAEDKLEEYTKFIQDTTRYITKHFECKHLGTKNIISTPGLEGISPTDFKAQLLSRLNQTVDTSKSLIVDELGKKLTNPLKEYANTETRKGILEVVKNGRLEVYQMDPYYAKALTVEPTITNVVARGFYLLKNFQQSTLTGEFNPTFAPKSADYTMYEAFTALPTLGKLLNLGKISRLEYLKECFHNIKNVWSDEMAKYIAKQYERSRNKIVDLDYDIKDPNLKDKLKNANLKGRLATIAETNALQERLATLLKTNAEDPNINLIHTLQDGGIAQSRPYNKTNDRVIVLNNKSKITPKTRQLLDKIHTPDGAKKVIDIINMMQNLIRDVPALSVNTMLAKKLKVKYGVEKLDQRIMDRLAYVVNRNMANSVLRGAGTGALGSLSEFIRNYFSYGSITINSIAPKIRASGISKGIDNIKTLLLKSIDKNVTYADVLNHMGTMLKSGIGNEYIKSLIYVSVIPSIISYIWNHGSEDNMKAYYSYSDSNKGSKFILTNVFGKGVHLVIPKDQEIAISDAIVYSVLDSWLNLSKYNPEDPGFKTSGIFWNTLARSMGLDGNPTLNLFANMQGYNISLNAFDDRSGITQLTKNVVNNDLSETAYQNGWVNQQITNIINNIFGTLGSALLVAAEEGKVGNRQNIGTGMLDSITSFLDRTFGYSYLLPINSDITRNVSSANETAKEVYKTRQLLDKIASVTNKTPQQEAIYNLIKTYRRNRIQPIKDEISSLRKDLVQIKANGRTADGDTHSYYSRKNNMNEVNIKLIQLFRNEYNEYKKLDNLIQQQYGVGINMENFMEKFSNLNGAANE